MTRFVGRPRASETTKLFELFCLVALVLLGTLVFVEVAEFAGNRDGDPEPGQEVGERVGVLVPADLVELGFCGEGGYAEEGDLRWGVGVEVDPRDERVELGFYGEGGYSPHWTIPISPAEDPVPEGCVVWSDGCQFYLALDSETTPFARSDFPCERPGEPRCLEPEEWFWVTRPGRSEAEEGGHQW